jgi:hypothetical protein
MNSLVKVPAYSKLNFQGENFFTQNWCNITLILHKIALKYWMKIKNVEIWIQLLLTLSFEFIYKTERDRGNRTAYSRKLLTQ